MTAAVLSIGTEITRGEIVNTNASWLAAQLTQLGFHVTEIAEVDDDRPRIVATLKRLAAAHEVVVCTGGLGPTTDDLTTESVALAAGLPLVRDPATISAIEKRFCMLARVMVPSNVKQADFPSGAQILANAVGTAPGFAIPMGRSVAYFLPGVPSEMQRIFADHIQPALGQWAPTNQWQLRLHTLGQGESAVGEALQGVEDTFPGVTIGYRATFPVVEVKVLAQGIDQDHARALGEIAVAEVKRRLGNLVFAQADTTLVGALAESLRSRGWKLALAESCTGGLVAQLLTSEPASDYLTAGIVTYSNEAKASLLNVPMAIIERHGAVSTEVAQAMASGVARRLGADVGVGITGIAGPTGGSAEKPVGLVHWAVSSPDGLVAQHRVFVGSRARVQRAAAFAAMNLVRRVALRLPPE